MPWTQRTLKLTAHRRGFHLITSEVLASLPEIAKVRMGVLHVFIQHTSASLTINENADPDVWKVRSTPWHRKIFRIGTPAKARTTCRRT